MNRREYETAERWRERGWKPMKDGAPDFLMLKVGDNSITAICAVEVKSKRTRLSYEQKIWRRVLEQAGIKYVVEVVE